VGHAWVAWCNFRAAKATGGTFSVIIDDLVYDAQCLDLRSMSVEKATAGWVDSLTWLFGEPPDRVAVSSEFTAKHDAACEQLGIRRPVQFGPLNFVGDPVFQAVPATVPPHEYAVHPSFVVARVVDDRELGVEGFVRGTDLVRECALYDYFCHALGYPSVRQSYVPTVTRAAYAPGKKESSSANCFTVNWLKAAGYQPAEIIETLEECNRRSRKAGLEQNVLPVGVLEPEQVRVMESRAASEEYRKALEDATGMPWEADVREAVRRRGKAEKTSGPADS
jgi:glutamyl/glutaminyl-tRNA synthetase